MHVETQVFFIGQPRPEALLVFQTPKWEYLGEWIAVAQYDKIMNKKHFWWVRQFTQIFNDNHFNGLSVRGSSAQFSEFQIFKEDDMIVAVIIAI